MNRNRYESGFALIGAIIAVVVLGTMAAAVARLSTTQQATSAQDVLAAHANQAARAGVEWSLFRIGMGECNGATTLTNFHARTGFFVTVRCSFVQPDYREGESATGTAITKRFYEVNAVACNFSGGCPADAFGGAAVVASAEYVERRRVAALCVDFTVPAAPGDCF